MPRIVAIDLGGHTVKASVWRGAGRKYGLEARYSMPVPQDGSAPPGMPARLAALDALLDEHGELVGPTHVVAVAIAGERAVLHHVVLPFSDQARVEKTLPFAVEADVPFDLDDMVMGWRITEKSDQTKVLVALSPREEIEGLIDQLAERKVEPRHLCVDTELLSAFAGAEEVVAIIDIGHSHTLMSVVANRQVLAVRAIDVGGWHFTRAIQQALRCSWEEAEAIKHGERVVEADQEQTDPGDAERGYALLPDRARQAVDAQIGLLLAEVRSTLIGAEDKHGIEIEAVNLVGGGALLAPLRGYLAHDLGLQVQPASDPDGDVVPAMFGVADALAWRVRGNTAAIDLRAGELAFRGGFDLVRTASVGYAIFIAVFTVIGVGWWGVQTVRYSAMRSDHEQRAQQVVAEAFPGEQVTTSSALQRMHGRIQEANARAAALGGAGRPPMTDILHALTNAFPAPDDVTVDVTQLTITLDTIDLKAETDSYASADAVEESLQADERFRNADRKNDVQRRDKIEFEIHIPLHNGGGVAEEAG